MAEETGYVAVFGNATADIVAYLQTYMDILNKEFGYIFTPEENVGIKAALVQLQDEQTLDPLLHIPGDFGAKVAIEGEKPVLYTPDASGYGVILGFTNLMTTKSIKFS